jgi:hypothetical protein
MHKQFRVVPIASPPDVEKLLRRIKDADLNVAGAGGGNVEFGGEFVFAVDHGQEDRAEELLNEHGYTYRLFDKDADAELTVCRLENRPGQLHQCIADVSTANLDGSRIIRDIIIGFDEDGSIAAQVFSEQVRTPATT